MITIHTQLIGQPQTNTDARGTWQSAIFRTPVAEPLLLQTRGLSGDQVADTKNHGSLDQAVCCHPSAHYDFWNDFYQLADDAKLSPGSVGENWTLTNYTEADVAVGDIFKVGSAVVQVSAPRYPCMKQERKLGLPNFLQEVLAHKRTGFYLRVLTPGEVKVGDELQLVERPNPIFTIQLVNENTMGTPDADVVEQLLALPTLSEGWKRILEHKLSSRK
ncbi:MAG: MOSC domain-containing protein [Ardenticatenaceae bacterium]|nr:MOSC domain-containing protein [Ardenticatenaceae bacterium]